MKEIDLYAVRVAQAGNLGSLGLNFITNVIPKLSDEERERIEVLLFKASCFDTMNNGIGIYERETGRFIGKFLNQIEASHALGVAQSTISEYLTGKKKSKKYIFKRIAFYTKDEVLRVWRAMDEIMSNAKVED